MKNIVIDFDGTLIRKNSFPLWIKFVIKKSFFSIRGKTMVTLVWLLIQRKLLKRMGHIEFKEKVDALNVPSHWGLEFMQGLESSLSRVVFHYVNKDLDQSTRLIISTAAPECYAKYIPEVFFSEQEVICLFSYGFDKKGYFNNFQENKLTSYKRVAQKGETFILFSDHSDDYELSKNAEKFYLCNPRKEHQVFFNERNVTFTLIRDSSYV